MIKKHIVNRIREVIINANGDTISKEEWLKNRRMGISQAFVEQGGNNQEARQEKPGIPKEETNK